MPLGRHVNTPMVVDHRPQGLGCMSRRRRKEPTQHSGVKNRARCREKAAGTRCWDMSPSLHECWRRREPGKTFWRLEVHGLGQGQPSGGLQETVPFNVQQERQEGHVLGAFWREAKGF